MRIVHDHSEVLPLAHELKSSRHARKRRERGGNIRRCHVLGKARTDGSEHIVHVEQPRDARMQVKEAFPAVPQRQLHAVARELHILCRQIGRIVNAIGDDRAARICAHRLRCRIVSVQHRCLARLRTGCGHELKEMRLGARIVFHGFMEVKMILRQIRKDRRIELDPCHAPECKRMRGHLHDDCIHAARAHFGKHLLKHNDVGRRIRRRQHLVLDHRLNRPDQPDTTSRMAQDGAHEIARRRLSVRPRDADDTHGTRRITIEERDDRVQCFLQIRHVENGDPCGNIHRGPLCQNSAGSCPRHIWYETVCIDMCADDAGKECALPRPARITLNGRNLRLRIPHDARSRQECGEFLQTLRHRTSFPFMRKIRIARHAHPEPVDSNRLDARRRFQLGDLNLEPLVLLLQLVCLLARL